MKSKVKKRPPKEEKFIEEDDDKRIIVFIAIAVLAITAIIIGLLVGCQKEEEETQDPNPETEIEKPTSDDEETKKDEVEEELVVEEIKTTVKKVNNKQEKKSFVVTFYFQDEVGEHVYRKRVTEGKKVDKYLPEGYDSCVYSTNNDYTDDFNFNTNINSATEIYMECDLQEYTILYDVTTENNPSDYTILDGTIDLNDYVPEEGEFVGWYLDEEFTNKVSSLSQNIIAYADSENVIRLYAKVVEDLSLDLYKSDSSLLNHVDIQVVGQEVLLPRENSACIAEDVDLLGWTTINGSSTINYAPGENIEVFDDMSLYPVCGSAVVIYESETETVVKGYTEEEIEEYEVPTTEELGIETPTYYIPVEEPTETSKEIVEDDRPYVAENEIKLEEVEDKKADGYTPSVGDNVEEIEKEFEGWNEIDPPADPEPIEEDFVPSEDVTELEAEWSEPITYEETPPDVTPPEVQQGENTL